MTRRLSETERRLWRKVADTAKPLRGAVRIYDPEPEKPALAIPESGPSTPTQPEKPAKTRKATPKPTTPPPGDASGHRRIRRGDVPIDAKIDLHGLSQDEAKKALIGFVLAQHKQNARKLLVITGKGRDGTGVLRSRFPDWINAPEIRPLVAEYAPAHVRHGGGGAFYLLLKAKKKTGKA